MKVPASKYGTDALKGVMHKGAVTAPGYTDPLVGKTGIKRALKR